MRIFFTKQLTGILCCALLLVACCENNTPQYIQRTFTHEEYIKMLQKQGVQIIRTGETYTVVIPSDDLFNPYSANFSSDSMQVLGPLAAYLCSYETTFMKISGYTDGGAITRSLALSERQAQRVQEFLTTVQCATTRHLDARIMMAVGYGPYYPIADNSIPSHAVQNRRIVIKFRRVVVPPLV